MTAYVSPGVPRLLSPPVALPIPSGFLEVLLLLTFFVHLVLVNVLLGSMILSVINRRISASDRKGGVAFMPKVLALAVSFDVTPSLFLQVLYGHFLYFSIVFMIVWWIFVALFAILTYYGLYMSGGAIRPARRTPILFLSALLLLMTAFLLSNTSILILHPDFWFRWFLEPYGRLLNTSDLTLFPRYLHILLASLAVGGLVMTWRARRSKRNPGVNREETERRFHRELNWFLYVLLAQVPVGSLFLFTLPPDVHGLFLGGDVLSVAVLILAISGPCIAFIFVWQGVLKLASTAALGVILVTVYVHDIVRGAMFQPYSGTVPPAPTALTVPHGQTATLSFFLVATVLMVAVLAWLDHILFHALSHNENSEIREGRCGIARLTSRWHRFRADHRDCFRFTRLRGSVRRGRGDLSGVDGTESLLGRRTGDLAMAGAPYAPLPAPDHGFRRAQQCRHLVHHGHDESWSHVHADP